VPTRVIAAMIGGLSMLAAALAMASAGIAPVLVRNVSVSVPVGLYVRAVAAVAEPGRIVAFRTPRAAAAYIAAHLPFHREHAFLKPVLAAAGDRVCLEDGGYTVNGTWFAPTATHDPQGRALPVWRGCRRLAGGELFVFSDRTRWSFDSRHYGPIDRDDILGVYLPLWTH
jgi:conjugative transfer signal peptidase TraF